MRRLGFVLSALIVGCAIAPTSAHAGAIQCFSGISPCILIGQFSWDRAFIDDITFDDVFTIDNQSDVNSQPLNDTFEQVELELTFSDGTLDTTLLFSDLDAGLQTDTLGQLLSNVSSARLLFLFGGSGFSVDFASAPLVDTELGLGSLTTEIYAEPMPVPEPSSLVLLGSGVALVLVRRRRQLKH